VASTTPWAKVLVDGKDIGRNTPIVPRSKIELSPGQHKVTFVAQGKGKRFDFKVIIKAGETTRLIEKLPVEEGQD